MTIKKKHICFSWKTIIFLYTFLWVSVVSSFAQDEINKADSIIYKVLKNKEWYGNRVQSYDAEVYVKGNSYVKKKNIFLRYAPDALYLDKKGQNSLTESFFDIHFEAPNHFRQQVRAIDGTQMEINDVRKRVMQFLSINIYNPTVFNSQILMPGIKDTHKYYRFKYVSSTDTLNYRLHKIEIIPLIRSQKLVSGYLYVVDGLWTIFSSDIRGRSSFFKFRVETEFGLPKEDFLLPLSSRITFQMNLLGNDITNHYYSSFKYKSISKHEPETKKQETNYNLSDYFSVQIDSIPIFKDSLFWEENRPIPLTDYERSLFDSRISMQRNKDSLAISGRSWNFSQGLIEPKRFRHNQIRFKYSGLLNPFKIAYSKRDGVTYWQQFSLNKVYDNGQEIEFKPNIGFMFQRKEFYFNTPTRWIFQPLKMGEVSLSLGNRNQSYNSTIISEIKREGLDSIGFDNLKLDYFRHFYLEAKSKYEIANGLLLQAGIGYDWYNPVNSNREELDPLLNKYRNFAPTLGATWTPKQYYRINGKKKEYVGSLFPTFSFEYGRGIKDFLKGDSDYERIELDVQQKISLGLLKSFQYYVGAGTFTKTKSVYFADFKKFQRHNFPQSWNDPIGGVFHLLKGEWYNASDSYAQAFFMYESPFSVLRLFRRVIKDVITERIYLSQLYTPVLPCYTEIGFGVGNFVGNAGAFVSLKQGKFESFGVKAVLELGQ